MTDGTGSGVAINIGDGHASFTGGNPSVTTGYSNTQTPKNVVKAWAYISVASAAATLEDGFNIASVSISGQNVVVNIASDLATTNYAAIVTLDGAGYSTAPRITNRAVGSFEVLGPNFTLGSGAVNVVVLGAQ